MLIRVILFQALFTKYYRSEIRSKRTLNHNFENVKVSETGRKVYLGSNILETTILKRLRIIGKTIDSKSFMIGV